MKVGIVTITELENFGNRLQNYALQETLKSLGAEVETIPNYITYRHRKRKSWQLKKLFIGLKNRSRSQISEIIKIKRFEKFDRKHFTFSKYYSEINYIPKDLESAYDYFVAGSDQIWNPIFPFNLDFNFLKFCDKSKRVAYSGSFGVEQIPEKYEKQITDYINGFPDISVREFSGQNIVRDLTGKEARVLFDPTLLLDRCSWQALSRKPKWLDEDKKYILVYYLGKKEALTKILESVNQSHPDLASYEIIDIHDQKLVKQYTITPDEFVWLIDHAGLMITDSFHGTVFSILMETPFIHSLREGGVNMNSRIFSLFKELSLPFSEAVYTDHINNTDLQGCLAQGRAEAKAYLQNHLRHD